VSWSKIPLALRIAAFATLGIAVANLVVHPFHEVAIGPRYALFRAGLIYAAKCFAVYGAVELAGLLHARAALGAKLAALGWTVTIVLGFVEVIVGVAGAFREPVAVTMQWVWWAGMLAVGVGLAIAASRRPALAIAGVVLWLLAERPPIFDNWMWKQLSAHYDARVIVITAQRVLEAALMIVLASVAVGDVPDGFVVRDPQRIRWGHTKIANALWLRVIAISALPVVTLAIIGSHNSASGKALGYAIVVGGAINSLSFLGIGLGALDAARANHPDLQRTPFYLGAAGSLWCAGVTLYQLPDLHEMLFGDHSGFLAERTADAASAFAILLPLVASGAIVMWTVGVAGLAVRRERLDLSERAHRTGMWFVILWVANLGVTQWLLPEARSDSSALLLLLLALACGLAAIINAARLARDTAELGNVEQATIPTATLV